MKSKITLLIFSLIVSFGMLFGQNNQSISDPALTTGRTCGVVDHEAYLQQQDPSRAIARQAFEQLTQNYAASQQNTNTTQAVITIPVVVHVIWNTAAENIPDNQILSQIQVLNEDYSLTNADASLIPSAFSGVAGNFGVQFCMAQRTPAGLATTGIERRNIATNVAFSTNDAVKHFSSNGLDAWDPTRYMNMWVCNLGSSLLGYAEFPTTTVSQTYGVVILYNAFGSNYTSYGTFTAINTVYNRGRTVTHELGHCFNLLHIWGDDNGACSGSDQCADTPNQANMNFGCPTFPHTDACTASGNGVMFMNYMDYTDDPCMYMFTNNQKTRALAVLNGTPYNALQTSNGCQAPAGAPPVADFTFLPTSACVGAAVNFTDISTGSPTSWAWTFPGGTPGTSTLQNPTGVTWATAGTKTVTLIATNANGSNTITHTIVISALPTVSTSASATTICSGSTTTLTGIGATTYTWMPGNLSGSPVTVSPTTTTTYTVTGTNAAGCSNTATRPITVNPSPTVTATATSVSLCTGGSTTLSATGATTYNWMPGNHNGTPWTVTPATTTTYTVTGTTTGCTSTATLLITVTPTPTVTTTTTAATICSGSSTTITASGATTYAWMPGSLSGTTVTVSPATTTTYTVTGTSGTCTGTATRIITVNPSPTVTATATSATICSGSSTTLSATGASTYNWMPGNHNGTPWTVTPATTTTYTVTGTAVNGCTATATKLITVTPTPTVTTTTANASICSGSSTTITASGATTYAWMPGSLTGTTVTVTPATTTTYTVTGTSGTCTGTATQIITVTPTPTVTTTTTGATICNGSTTTITASGATTYAWMPGSLSGTTVTVSPTTTTTYTVTGTTGACTGTATRTITVNPSPTVTATATNASICVGGSTILSATGATTYNWMPGNHNGTPWTVTPATTTTYTVTGTAAGCTGTATLLITVTPTPTVTTTTTAASICNGDTTTITASGATTYAWMPGSLSGTTVSVHPTTTTTYTVTGTSGTCTGTATRTITVNALPIIVTTTATPTICAGNSATIFASGGITYTWTPGNMTGNSVTVSPTTSTVYTVYGTNAAGCTNSTVRVIVVNPSPTVTLTASASSICVGNSTSITASGASSYSWMPGSLTGSTVTVTPATTTTYTVTGTQSGCTSTATQLITVSTPPTINTSTTANTICEGDSTTITASGASAYAWMPGNLTGTTVTVSPAANTTYTVTETSSGCASTTTQLIAVNAAPSVTATSTPTIICVGGSVTLNATGAVTYNWLPQNTTGASIIDTPASSTTYTVTGTDAFGCTNTDSIFVTVNAIPTITVSGDTLICPGANATLNASGATTYAWMPGSLSGSSVIVTPSSATTYTVTGSDPIGCSNTATITVNINTAPAAPSISVNGVILTSTVTGVSYQWFLNGNPIVGATSQSYTATQNGSYTVEVYNAAGCGSGQSSAVVDPTGIESSSSVEFINLSPNPNDGHFQLNFNIVKEGNYILEIHNTLGQIVYSETLNNFNGIFSKQMDLSVYGKGVYSIRLKNATNETVIKTVVY